MKSALMHLGQVQAIETAKIIKSSNGRTLTGRTSFPLFPTAGAQKERVIGNCQKVNAFKNTWHGENSGFQPDCKQTLNISMLLDKETCGEALRMLPLTQTGSTCNDEYQAVPTHTFSYN